MEFSRQAEADIGSIPLFLAVSACDADWRLMQKIMEDDSHTTGSPRDRSGESLCRRDIAKRLRDVELEGSRLRSITD